MRLPYLHVKDPSLKMPNNRTQATTRMGYLKRKFLKGGRFRTDYTNFVTEIIQKGYAKEVPAQNVNRNDGRVWYLPHYGVYHEKTGHNSCSL